MTEHNLLYEACTNSLVSDRCATETWEKVAKFVTEQRLAGRSYEEVKEQFIIVEKQIKADFKIKSLPASWRSAKSTALAALNAGVVLVDSADVVIGKTAISKASRVPKYTELVDPIAALHDRLNVALNTTLPPLTNSVRSSLLSLVDSLRAKIRGAPDA